MRSLLFHLLWGSATLLIGLAGLPSLLWQNAAFKVAIIWLNVSLWLVQRVAGIRLDYNLPDASRPLIFVSKHQSTLETLLLWKLAKNPAFILKRQLLWIPVFGWYLAAMRPIAIERTSREMALATIRTQAAAKLAEGRNIVIFPEGTRRAADAPPCYRLGGLSLLMSLGVTLQPVALWHAHVWPKSGRMQCGVARLRFLPAVQPAAITAETLCEHIEQESQRLRLLDGAGG